MVEQRAVPTLAFLLALLGIGSSYWICSWVVAPHASLDQRILFRPEGDGDYLPQVASLSSLNLGEASVLESAHTGVRSFPVVVLFLHAAMVRLLGDAGFVLADILVLVLYGYLLSRLLQTAGVARGLAEPVAVIVVSGLANLLVSTFSRIIGSIPLRFWSWRFPRPSVTELFVIIFIILLIRLADSGIAVARLRDWLVVGVLGSCLLQVDIYPAIALAIATGVVVSFLLLKDFKGASRGLCVAAPAAAVTATPFLFQRLHELPDIPRRWGMFVIQGHHWLMFTPVRLFVIIAAVLLVGVAYWHRSAPKDRPRVRATVAVMSVVLVVSAITGPLTIFLLGKGIQVYHFSVAAETMAGYALLISFCWLARDAFGSARIVSMRGALAFGTAAVFIACMAVASWLSYQSMEQIWWGRTQAAVPDPRLRSAVNRAAETRYRSAFEELHGMLGRPEWRQADVLGTFDGQVANWWQYRGKHLYLPDVFNSTLSDSQIETRIYSFMHLLQTTPEEFSQAVENWYFLLRVHSESKYQSNVAYTPWPLGSYTRAAQLRILHTDVQSATNLELPEPEKARLMEAYTHFDPLTQPPRKLDLIVLSTGGLRQYVHPEKGRLKLVWKSQVFELWIPEPALLDSGGFSRP